MTSAAENLPVPQNQNTSVVTGAELQSRLDAMGVSTKDIAFTRIHLLQPTSGAVGDEKGKTGDIINMGTNEVLGGVDSPLELIPLMNYKTWIIEDVTVKPPKFIRQVPYIEAGPQKNSDWKWDGVDKDRDGKEVPVKRTECFNFFVLLAKEIAEGEGFPAVIRFKSSSFNTGKQLSSHLWKMATIGKPAFEKTVIIGVTKQKKEQNTYAVYTMAKGRVTTEDERKIVQAYLPGLDALKAKVDEIAEGSEQPAAPVVVPEVSGGSDNARF
jgi:hypothetical protein